MPDPQPPPDRRAKAIRPLPPRRDTPDRSSTRPTFGLYERRAFRGEVALAHASIVLYVIGVLIAVVVWALRRDESRYAAFQAVQAVVWQVLFLFAGFLVNRVVTNILIVGLVGDLASGGEIGTSLAWLCTRAIILLVAGFFVLLGLYAAWSAWIGRDFRYPVVSGWVERVMFPG